MQEMASDVLRLVRGAGGKLVGNWPTLLALVLAGFTVKLATLKLALLAGAVGWALGVAIFAFTAAGLAAAVMFMFRSLLPGQPWPKFPMVLAPFLMVYVATDHFDGYLIDPALERQVTMDVSAAVVLIVAVMLRWLMPLWTAVQDRRWAGWVRTGLDICWMSMVAFTIASHPLSRWLAELTHPVSWLFSAVFTVLLVPLAWLAVGVLALGFRPLDAPELVRRAGVPLTLITCLLIVVVQQVPLLLWQIERLAIGTRDPEAFWQPITGLIGAANSAIGVLLVVCLAASLLIASGADEAGVAGQRGGAHDPYRDRFGVGGRDEEDGHLVGI
ncbi:hypothetical protein [Rhizocola hellebori]|uniref:hypothetical protein n=1 Tax=Rhizocola hellebori TaxID=1392758 RepID=UPI0019432D15|nr:hypothetical protein [Rhizocola hellebori]